MADLNETPSGERIHIGIFGKRNAGKSSLINALTGQNIAIVSNRKGTTTDPVYKAMELLPLGPVMLIDTPGIDDDTTLGIQRIKKTYQVLNKTDIALLVIDTKTGMTSEDTALLNIITSKRLNCIVVFNINDDTKKKEFPRQFNCPAVFLNAQSKENIEELKAMLGNMQPSKSNKKLVSDLLKPKDLVILVTPIDNSAPKGRIILPQQQVLREIIDNNALAVFTQPAELPKLLDKLKAPPDLVITDSQAFGLVNKILDKDIPLTSFSILYARYKGNLKSCIAGVKILDSIKSTDKILISEGCTHHRQCGDIGTEKIPGLIRRYTNCEPNFTFTGGGEFPLNLDHFKLIIHCGGCMLTEREVRYRYQCAADAQVPITNYGITLAYLNGILPRVISPFKL